MRHLGATGGTYPALQLNMIIYILIGVIIGLLLATFLLVAEIFLSKHTPIKKFTTSIKRPKLSVIKEPEEPPV